ncbi:MAG: universal stress protein [Acidimicrobiales bacterium]
MYGTIVVGTDGSPTARTAVARAAELAAQAGAKLVIISAYRPVGEERLRSERAQAPDDVAYGVNSRAEVDRVLADAEADATGRGAKDVHTTGIDSGPAEALLDAADKLGAGLLVVGSVGMTGARRFLLGSVPNRIAHHAPCDVLIVKTDDARVGGDGRDDAG